MYTSFPEIIKKNVFKNSKQHNETIKEVIKYREIIQGLSANKVMLMSSSQTSVQLFGNIRCHGTGVTASLIHDYSDDA